MSSPVSALHASIPNGKQDPPRRVANYHPSIWGGRFLSYANFNSEVGDDEQKRNYENLKEIVRKMLSGPMDETIQKLKLIDASQRLGISYHFEREIEKELERIFNSSPNGKFLENLDGNVDLNVIALWFRLLRQQGYHVSSDVFEQFKDSDGNFKLSLSKDVHGMLSLYEASHFRGHNEHTLDAALDFTTTHLSSMVAHLVPFLAAQVRHALRHPIRKSLERIEARRYISVYEMDNSHNQALLTFAKLDFNNLQKLHQKELGQLSMWWKDLDVTRKLPYARDRLVECYFWILGVQFEPKFALSRRITTKVIAMLSIIDDTYDVYGTLEELKLFTDAIERLDINSIDQLPEYMQVIFKAFYDVYKEMEEVTTREGRPYCTDYFKKAMTGVAKAYLAEEEWSNKKYMPTVEEYMNVALVSGTYLLLTLTSFIGIGEFVTKDALDWVLSFPKMVRASSIICRLMDDIVSHEFEQTREHVASGIEIYMKQYGTSKEEVCDEFHRQVDIAWKDMNEECLKPTQLPIQLLKRIVNLASVIDTLYGDEDGYTNSKGATKGWIESVLLNPIEIYDI